MNFQDISLIKGYHAHVYFDESTLEQAKMLCEEAGKQFSVTVGRIHQKPVDPHPSWSCQLAFSRSEYADLLSWLALNRAWFNNFDSSTYRKRSIRSYRLCFLDGRTPNIKSRTDIPQPHT